MAGRERAPTPQAGSALTPTPVFLFSLPRSGSTLVQRMLATSPEVATTTEPWVLLPQLYAFRLDGAYAEYGHRTAARALADFCATMPGGRRAYLDEVRRSVLALYGRAAGEAVYFLDKTPRYHLVVDEILELFPEARCIFLWRHPLAVAASMIESFGSGRWNLFRYEVDLYGGLERLVAARSRSRSCHAIRYEDVALAPATAITQMFAFLELPVPGDTLDTFARVRMNGRMGDRIGSGTYSAVTAEPLGKWRRTMSNPLRKRWCREYVKWIGSERLEIMGYDKEALLAELDGLPADGRAVGSDVVRRAHGRLYRRRVARVTARRSGPAPQPVKAPADPALSPADTPSQAMRT